MQKDRFFDYNLGSHDPRFLAAENAIYEQLPLSNHFKKYNEPAKREANQRYLANLIQGRRSHQKTVISLDKKHYVHLQKFYGEGYTYNTFRALTEGYDQLGYIVVEKGQRFGNRSTIEGAGKLLELLMTYGAHGCRLEEMAPSNEIILRSVVKAGGRRAYVYHPYLDTQETRRWRKDLMKHNEALRSSCIQYQLPGRLEHSEELVRRHRFVGYDYPFGLVRPVLAEKDLWHESEVDHSKPLILEMKKKLLYRVFNVDDSFQYGGRFQGGSWITDRKMFRPYLLMDGEQTVDLDYPSFHPKLLCNLQGKDVDGDPYCAVDGRKCCAESCYGCEFKRRRATLKRTMNIMINCKDRRQSGQAIRHDRKIEFYPGENTTEITNKILEVHAFIRPLLFDNDIPLGLRLMNLESRLINRVICILRDQHGVIALPIHDAIAVPKKYAALAQQIMNEAYEQMFGFPTCAEIKTRSQI